MTIPTLRAGRLSRMSHLILATVAISCCARDATIRSSGSDSTAQVFDSTGIRIVETHGPTWATPWRIDSHPTTVIGDESRGPEHQLYRVVGSVTVRDGNIMVAVLGSHELRIFDVGGTHVRTVGGDGAGPGEFRSLMAPLLGPGDSIWVFDPLQDRVSVYDESGGFVRSQRIEPTAGVPIPGFRGTFEDGTALLVEAGGFALGARGPSRVEERSSETLFRLDFASGRWDSVGAHLGPEFYIGPSGGVRPSGEEVIGRSPRQFGLNTAVAVVGSRFVVADNARYEIKLFSPSGRLETIVRRDWTPQPVTDVDVEQLRAQQLERLRDDAVRERVARAYEQHPYRETFPAFAPDLRVDRDENLWVQEYRKPADTNERWTVFDSAGVMYGTVALPDGVTLLFAGRDHILGLTKDGFDVERVVRYPLLKN